MNKQRDPERLIHAFLTEGPTELADPVFDAVRDTIEHKRQRVVIGPWRLPDMNKLVPIALGVSAVVVVLVVGTQLLGPSASSGSGGAASPSPPIGGTVTFQMDGGPATTKVSVVTDGASLSGTAVTTFVAGTHTVDVECAVRDGDTWAFGGTIKETTVSGEPAGDWSAVVVKDGSPQRVGFWLSDTKAAGSDCDAWLTAIDMSTIDAENFRPVESGALVPPPALAP